MAGNALSALEQRGELESGGVAPGLRLRIAPFVPNECAAWPPIQPRWPASDGAAAKIDISEVSRQDRIRGCAEFLCRTEAPQRLQGRDHLRSCRLAGGPNRDASLSVFRNSELGGSIRCADNHYWIPDRHCSCLGF